MSLLHCAVLERALTGKHLKAAEGPWAIHSLERASIPFLRKPPRSQMLALILVG